jgi:nucleoid DNA-binding protein
MNKLQLTEQLAARLGITHSDGERFVNTFIKLVYEELHQGGKVNISGFGQFSVSHRAPRKGVNPRTLAEITIPELNTPKFKAGEAFKAAVALKN